mgnify:CR=1 FL=1
MILKIIGIVFILGWIWLIWEACNAPVMPDDYNLPEEKDKSFKEFQKKYPRPWKKH